MAKKKNKVSDPIQSSFDKIVSKIIGTTTKKELDNVDDVLDKISDTIVDKHSFKYAEVIKNSIIKSMDVGGDESWAKKTLGDLTQELVDSEELQGRYWRYNNADEIVDNIPYCSRALKVITDGILSPDDVSKEVINITGGKDLSEKDKSKIGDIRAISDHLGLEGEIHDIISNTLSYGDQFVEFASYKSKEVPVTQVILTEADRQGLPEDAVMTLESVDIEYLNENGEAYTKTIEPVVVIDEAVRKKKKDEDNPTSDKPNLESALEEIKLIVHDSRAVIKIQSRRFKMCLGYLVIPINSNSSSGATMKTNQNLNKKITGYDPRNTNLSGVEKVYAEIMKAVSKYIGRVNVAKDAKVDKKELVTLINRAMAEIKNTDDQKLIVRYVPPERMEHFCIYNKRFFPYGESIFYKSMWQAKLLIALEVAVTIKRVSDSSDKRMIIVDASPDRQVRNIIADFQEKTKKRKHSVDSWGNISSIPSMITSYEEYYIPRPRGGEPAIQFDRIESPTNIRDVTDELKFFRDMLVSSLDVPPAYMNLEENLSSCVSTTYIELTNGKKILLKEMIDRFEKGEEFEVISYDEDLGVVFPNKVTWAGYTQFDVDAVKITLDNGEFLIITPEHKMMKRSGEYVEAGSLQPGDSLMPFYKKMKPYIKSRNKEKATKYNYVYHPGIDVWDWMHRSFSHYTKMAVSNEHCHHIDMNPLNNSTKNLVGLSAGDHLALHARTKLFSKEELTKLQENRKKLFELSVPGTSYEERTCEICGKTFTNRSDTVQTTCSSACRKIRHQQTGRLSWDSRKIDYDKKFPEITMSCSHCGKQFTKTLTKKLKKQLEEQPYKWYNCDDNYCAKMVRKANISMTKLKGRLWSNIEYRYCEVCENLYVYTEASRFGTWEEKQYKTICYNPNCLNKYRAVSTAQQRSEIFTRKREVKELILNHKVVKVEKLSYKIDCGDIRVETYHNFAVSAGIFIHNSNKAALAHENDVFARTIVAYQQMLTRNIMSLFSKLYKYIRNEKLPVGILVTFSPPKLLQIEREGEHFQQIQSIVQILEELGVNKEWLCKKYLNLPWEEIDKFERAQKLQDKIEGKDEGEEAPGGMGGGGGF